MKHFTPNFLPSSVKWWRVVICWPTVTFKGLPDSNMRGLMVVALFLWGFIFSNNAILCIYGLFLHITFLLFYVTLNSCHKLYHGSNELWCEIFIKVPRYQDILKSSHKHLLIGVDHFDGHLIKPNEILSHGLKVPLIDIEKAGGWDPSMFSWWEFKNHISWEVLVVSHQKSREVYVPH